MGGRLKKPAPGGTFPCRHFLKEILNDEFVITQYYYKSSLCLFYTLLFIFVTFYRFPCLIISVLFSKYSSKEVCDPEIGGNIVMCPQCDRECKYWRLNSTCEASKVSFILFFSFHSTLRQSLLHQFTVRLQNLHI